MPINKGDSSQVLFFLSISRRKWNSRRNANADNGAGSGKVEQVKEIAYKNHGFGSTTYAAVDQVDL